MTVHLRTATSLVLCLVGCGDPPEGGDSAANQSTLVDDSATLACNDWVTWDSFAHSFFLNWCTSCHSSSLTSLEDREQAPLAMNFDSYAGVAEYSVQIEYRAVTAEPEFLMPPIGGPTVEEREMLGLWIQCGMKEH
jgi:uncharacterized membrane protein